RHLAADRACSAILAEPNAQLERLRAGTGVRECHRDFEPRSVMERPMDTKVRETTMKTICTAVIIALAACVTAQAGPVLQGPVLQGPVLQGPVLQGPVLQGPVLQGAQSYGTTVGSIVIGSNNLAGIELPR